MINRLEFLFFVFCLDVWRIKAACTCKRWLLSVKSANCPLLGGLQLCPNELLPRLDLSLWIHWDLMSSLSLASVWPMSHSVWTQWAIWRRRRMDERGITRGRKVGFSEIRWRGAEARAGQAHSQCPFNQGYIKEPFQSCQLWESSLCENHPFRVGCFSGKEILDIKGTFQQI